MGWQDAPIVQQAGGQPAWASAPVVEPAAAAPKDGDPVPASGVPEGFYAVTGDDGKKTLRHESNFNDVIRALSDIPGVGMAERIGQGATRLAGKAASGFAGLVGGPEAVQKVQGAVNQATELPPSNDPIVHATNLLNQVAQTAAAPVDRAVSNLPPLLRGNVEVAEEAIPDIASVAGLRGLAPEAAAEPNIARSSAEVGEAAGYTGLKTRADLRAPGNQAITDALISKDAGIVEGQPPSVAALENARRVGPGRVYRAAEEALPNKLTQDPELQVALGNLPDQTSQLPRSPDVDALQETMLAKPNFTRDELFANIREARERAKMHWKSDDPDKAALGDAYHSLANAYEDFAGRQLEEADSPVSLPDWQAARTQMAKNYQAQGALRGEHFDPQVYARTAQNNPHLLTGNAAIVGHVANGLPAAAEAGLADAAMTAIPAAAGEALGHHFGVTGGGGVVGGMVGRAATPYLRAKLAQLRTQGAPELAAGTAGNPALSYFFDQGRLPEGWNRAPSSPLPAPFGGYLPHPDMVDTGRGAATQNTLDSLRQTLGLTPDVQAAGALHPATARLQALRERLVNPPERPAEPVDFQGPQKWGDFSIAPETKLPSGETRRPSGETIPFENVLEQGGTQGKPVAGIQRGYRPAPQSPKGPNMRTPPGAPTLAEGPPPGSSPAQTAFRNKLAADRLRKVAGDLRLEGPGGATGDPIERLRAALERRDRGYARGGTVHAVHH